MLYLISYDLKSADKNYDGLHKAIKGLGSKWWHYLDSTWFVVTNVSLAQSSEILRKEMDGNDLLLIIDVTDYNEVNGWLPSKAWEWLRNNRQG